MASLRRFKGMSIDDFRKRFSSEQDCREYLFGQRWPEGFVCPRCGCREAYHQQCRDLWWCRGCGHQVSVTAGTLFHKTHLPLWKWFWAIYRMGQGKKGLSAVQLMKEIDVSYPTAWLMMQKLRQAMQKRDAQYRLGGIIELDDAFVGGQEEGRMGRGVEEKTPILVAVEERKSKDGKGKGKQKVKPGYAAIEVVSQVSAQAVKEFAQAKISQKARVKTDGFPSYQVLAKEGYQHEVSITGGGKEACDLFPWVHVVIANLKRFILGTHHWVSRKHLDRYVGEFCYRLNRRYHEADIFEHLVHACLAIGPSTLAMVVRMS
jgi:hypothetical protein